MGAALDDWIGTAAQAIATAAAGVACVLDTSTVVIDGAMPPEVRARLVAAVRAALAHVDMQGISPFDVMEGTIGFDARAMGAASLPLFENFMINRNLLFKEQA